MHLKQGFIWITCLFWSLVNSVTFAAPINANVDIAQQQMLTDFQLLMYRDDSNGLDVNRLKITDFKQAPSRFTFPVDDATYWFHFTLENNSEKTIQRVLFLDENYAETADFYIEDETGFIEYKNGLDVSLNDRAIPYFLPAVTISLSPYEKKKVFFKTFSKKKLLVQGLNIATVEDFTEDKLYRLGFLMLFIGAISAIFLYNLFLFLMLRSKEFFYYLVYSLTFGIFAFSTTGFFLYLLDDLKNLHNFYPLITFSFIFTILFIRELIESPKTIPKGDYVLLFVLLQLVVMTLLVTYSEDYYYIVVATAPINAILILLVALYAVVKKAPFSLYIFAGMGIYITGLFVLAGTNSGLLDYNPVFRNGFFFGSIIEMILFSVALASRVKKLEQDKNAAQSELLAQQTNEQHRLETLVKEKTESLRQANEELKTLSVTDKVTQLLNRQGITTEFENRIAEFEQNKEPFALILLDIDHFKLVNDNYGHQVGDLALESLADILNANTRQQDSIGRWGGEEFLILLPATSLVEAKTIAETIRAAIETASFDSVDKITSSFGVSVFSAEDDETSVMRRVDQLLYQAKNQGRNQVCSA